MLTEVFEVMEIHNSCAHSNCRRRSRSPLGRRQLPPMYNRGPGVPVRRGPPPDMRRPENKARGSGNRGRSPSPPSRSPVRGGWRHDRSPPPPRGRSPRGPPPDMRRPLSPRRSLHGPPEVRSRHSGDRRGGPPQESHWPRSRSPRRPLSRSPIRAVGRSPRGSRLSPPVPRVPRDRRSPPKVAPPRPKHLRTPPPSTSTSLPLARSPSPSPRRERREDRERSNRSVEREKYGKLGDNDRGRKDEEVREHPSIPDEEADMSKSNTMTGAADVEIRNVVNWYLKGSLETGPYSEVLRWARLTQGEFDKTRSPPLLNNFLQGNEENSD